MIQTLPYRCYSPDCQTEGTKGNGTGNGTNIIQYFDVNINKPHKALPDEKCPYCRIKGHLTGVKAIHMVTSDTARQAFKGSKMFHKDHLDFGFMCAESADGYLHPKTPLYPDSFTNYPPAATCWYCLTEYGATARGNQLIVRS
jgi:hypothetical protein